MKGQSISKYWYFGTCMRYLQDADTDSSLSIKGGILDNIDRFMDYLDEFGLQVTKRVAYKLGQVKDSLKNVKEENANLTQEQAAQLRQVMSQLRETLSAEIEGFETYVVTPKRFETKKLLEDVASLMSPRVFAALPSIAQYDLAEAGKCIAFERPTAAAFHLLRGTESVLRMFYCSFVKRKPVSPQLWGPMVDDLRKHYKAKKYETLYNNLDNIRVSYRNPTQHPDKVYDIQEVQDLWGLCIEAINRMVKTSQPSQLIEW